MPVQGCGMLGAGCGRAPRLDSLMLSMSSESTTERLCSSPAMARSKAFCFTILLHSWYFILASLSWGFTFTTWAGRWAEGGREKRGISAQEQLAWGRGVGKKGGAAAVLGWSGPGCSEPGPRPQPPCASGATPPFVTSRRQSVRPKTGPGELPTQGSPEVWDTLLTQAGGISYKNLSSVIKISLSLEFLQGTPAG